MRPAKRAATLFGISGEIMRIETGVKFNYKRTYRLIGRNLYSVAKDKPLDQQIYELEKADVIEASQEGMHWKIIIKDGHVNIEA